MSDIAKRDQNSVPTLLGVSSIDGTSTVTIFADPSTHRLKVEGSGGGGTVTNVTATSPITSSGGTTPNISTSIATNKLLGRGTAGTGVVEQITLGTNLSLSGTTLNAAGGSTPTLSQVLTAGNNATGQKILNTDQVQIVGATDVVHLDVTAHATQTTDVAEIKDSSSNVLFKVMPSSVSGTGFSVSAPGQGGAGEAEAWGQDAQASGLTSLAVGIGSISSGATSMAIGNGAQATGNPSIAIGASATAGGSETITIGNNSTNSSGPSVLIGKSSNSSGSNSVVIGNATNDNGSQFGTVVGDSASVISGGSYGGTAIGASSSAFDGVAIGNGASQTGSLSVLIGVNSSDFGNGQAIGIGHQARTHEGGQIIIGTGSLGQSGATSSILIGTQANISGSNSLYISPGGNAMPANHSVGLGNIQSISASDSIVSVGYNTTINGDNSITIGDLTTSSTNSVVVGSGAMSSSTDVIVIGKGAQAAGGNSVAIGSGAVTIDHSVVIGDSADLSSDHCIVIGDHAHGDQYSVALGASAHCSSNSIALGAGATNTVSNQIVIGADTHDINLAFLGNGVTNATPSDIIINATGGTGTDINGANITIAGGIGTGAGLGGSIHLQVAPATTTSSTPNTLVDALVIDSTTKAVSYAGDSLAGNGLVGVMASGTQTGQTGSSTLCTKTTPVSGSYEIGGYIDVTAFTLGTVALQVAYNDGVGASKTLTVPVTSLAGVVAASIGATGDFSALTIGIRTDGSASIVVKVTATAFTGTYSGYGWVKRIT